MREDASDEAHCPTRAVRLVQRAMACAVRHATPSLLVREACCAIAPVLPRAASRWALRLTPPCLALVTRAQQNAGAEEPAPPPALPSRGRPPPYRTPIKRTEGCETPPAPLVHTSWAVYGHVATRASLALHRRWTPLTTPLRGVCALTSRGPRGRMGSPLDRDPLMVLTLEGARVRIATLCATLPSGLGAWTSRFGSTHCPRHARTPRTPPTLQAPPKGPLAPVRRTWAAGERFVM